MAILFLQSAAELESIDCGSQKGMHTLNGSLEMNHHATIKNCKIIGVARVQLGAQLILENVELNGEISFVGFYSKHYVQSSNLLITGHVSFIGCLGPCVLDVGQVVVDGGLGTFIGSQKTALYARGLHLKNGASMSFEDCRGDRGGAVKVARDMLVDATSSFRALRCSAGSGGGIYARNLTSHGRLHFHKCWAASGGAFLVTASLGNKYISPLHVLCGLLVPGLPRKGCAFLQVQRIVLVLQFWR